MPPPTDTDVVFVPSVHIGKPTGETVRGSTVTVNGTADCKRQTPGGGVSAIEAIFEVAIRLGASGAFVAANPTGPIKLGRKTWSTWTTDALPLTGVNDKLQITAQVSAGPVDAPATAQQAVTVDVEPKPPDVSLTTPDDITKEVENKKATFHLAGAASSDRLPIVAVEFQLGDGPFKPATPKAPNDWSSWTIDVTVSPAGIYTVRVKARDTANNNTTPPKEVTLHAVEKFEPKDPNDVFQPAAYLDDLLGFAERRMVDAQARPLARAMLTAAYRHLFDDLTKPENREPATEAVRQLRVCVEVLRSFLSGAGKTASKAEEAKYRQAAYEALLRNLGTSFDEIRRARGDEAARARLAARLGLDQPGRLEQLTLLPEQVTEAKLEQLFGLQDTTRNPLVRGPQALLLTSQLARLRAQWRDQDDSARVYDATPVPVIDPDKLVEIDFRTRNKDADPAFALWTARTAEMAALLKQIDALRKSKNTLLAGFDAVAGQFIASAEDLAALLADYQAGTDIGARLMAKRLEMAAFLQLMQIRDLAAAGTALDADWADVYAIAAQVAKLGRYPAWRAEERVKTLTLGPDYFVLPEPTSARAALPEWRATPQARRAWQVTLQTRISQEQAVVQGMHAVVDAAEADALPGLRDLLVATAGDAAGGLLIDTAAGPAQRTSRLGQAIETLQGALFAVRTGAFTTAHPAAGWKLADKYHEADFDSDWVFWGTYDTWQGAMRVFVYPESHLLPTLRPEPGPASASNPTTPFEKLIATLRGSDRVTPAQVRAAAAVYLQQLRTGSTDLPQQLKSNFEITEQLTDSQLAARQLLCATLMAGLTNPHDKAASRLHEVFYLVPLLCGLQLHRSGEYVAALDWFQTVYAYHLPPGRLTVLPDGKPQPDRRQIYYGLTLEERITTTFIREAEWPRVGLNPHDVARTRANALTRFAIISLVRCFEAFADTEFTRDTSESIASARVLYQTALDQLAVAYPNPSASSAPASPFGPDPVVEALRLHSESNLRKLRLGRNIAGLERQPSVDLAIGATIAPRQPTPYRYAALIARAKELTQTASQMEAALLAALEKRDGELYTLLKARQDVELAGQTVLLHNLRVKDATDGIDLAVLQQGRAQMQFDYFDGLIGDGTTRLETAGMVLGVFGSVVGGAESGDKAAGLVSTLTGVAIGSGLAATGVGAAIGLAVGLGSLFGQISSNERREREWRFNRNIAAQDEAIGGQQIVLAADQVLVSIQEQRIAQIQMDHAGATVQFLAGKFTSAELYEFMSEVLDGVYRFFLQQATALAKLAESQLAFERQELSQGIIQGDYYAARDGSSDSRGITGSARLLTDIVQLDQHAFLTDRRRLQLTKTLSLARLAPLEFEQFRRTGVLVIGTPQELFDRDFPGHYLRLVKRVRTSVIALIPPVDGIRATLSTAGISRVVIGGDTFQTAVVRRDAEVVGLSSPRDATGLFELVPDSQPELLLPFEGSGVDTVWRFELPKAANSFDYSTIADVLLTLEYTALNSFDYRQQVIQTLDAEFSSARPFSLRMQFPDQWYDLSNPEQSATPMAVRFKTTRGDFLPNINDLKIQQLTLFLAPANGTAPEIKGVRLLFKKNGDQTPAGGSADSIDGMISTRRANGSNWLPIAGSGPPVGEWEMALPTDEATKKLFRNEEIADILLVVTYSARTPEWPA